MIFLPAIVWFWMSLPFTLHGGIGAAAEGDEDGDGGHDVGVAEMAHAPVIGETGRVLTSGYPGGACHTSVCSRSLPGRDTELLWRRFAVRPQESSPNHSGTPKGRSRSGMRA